MARTGRPRAELILTDEERVQLFRWTRRRKSSQALALRARIVLACADGMAHKVAAGLVGCSAPRVTKWRSRFVEHRLDGLSDDPRPGRPAAISTDQVENIVGPYLNPPECAVVLSVHEKSRVQALSRSQPAFAMMPGRSEKRTHDNARHGTARHGTAPRACSRH